MLFPTDQLSFLRQIGKQRAIEQERDFEKIFADESTLEEYITSHADPNSKVGGKWVKTPRSSVTYFWQPVYAAESLKEAYYAWKAKKLEQLAKDPQK